MKTRRLALVDSKDEKHHVIALSNKKISQRTLISKSGVKFLCRTEPMSRNKVPENRSKFKTVRELILHCALPPVSVHCTERGEGVT